MKYMADARHDNTRHILRYGVELEAERAGHVPSTQGWEITTDGSLRNEGREFVFRGPVEYDEAVTRIKALYENISVMNIKPVHNARTSVHIHVDVTGMTPKGFASFVRNWACVEPALFDKYGQGREYSPYCVPLYQGREYLYRLLWAAESGASEAHMILRDYKYTALSCNRFIDLGTMEARVFNGTNDVGVMLEYLFVVNALAEGMPYEGVLAAIGSLDYLEQAQAIDKLINFERAIPLPTGFPSRGSRRMAELYRRDDVHIRVSNDAPRHWERVTASSIFDGLLRRDSIEQTGE